MSVFYPWTLGNCSPLRIQIILQVCPHWGWASPLPSASASGNLCLEMERERLSSALMLQIILLVLGQRTRPTGQASAALRLRLPGRRRQGLRGGGLQRAEVQLFQYFLHLEEVLVFLVNSQRLCLMRGRQPFHPGLLRIQPERLHETTLVRPNEMGEG